MMTFQKVVPKKNIDIVKIKQMFSICKINMEIAKRTQKNIKVNNDKNNDRPSFWWGYD